MKSQKKVWKDNRSSNANNIRTDCEHWLSSVVTELDVDDCRASETASQPDQEKLGDWGQ